MGVIVLVGVGLLVPVALMGSDSTFSLAWLMYRRRRSWYD